jgi:translocation and assembly module TamB
VIQTFILRRALLLIGIVVIATLIVAPVFIAWAVLYTTSGAQFVVRHLPHKMAGVTLDIVGLSGTVAHGLHIERVEIDHELVHLKFLDLSGSAALAPLLLQTIRVPHATLASAQIEVKRRVHPPTPSPPAFLPRWLLISAEDVHLKRVVLTVYNGAHLELADLTGAAVIRHENLRIFQADGLLDGAHVSATGELLAKDPLGLQAKAHLDWHPAGQPAYVLDGTARGDLNRLSVVARTQSPWRADITGQLIDLTGHLHWLASIFLHQLNLNVWGAATPLGDISARLSAAGDLDHFSASGPVNPSGLHAGVFDAQFEGGFAQQTLTAKRVEVRHVDTGAHVLAAGTLAMVDHGPRLDLKGSWNEFRWPLIGREVALRSAAGTFSIEGVLPYRVHVSGDARAADLPVMPADIVAILGKDGVLVERADVDLYGGHTSASGKVTWAPQETYAFTGHATGINPANFRADLPGALNFDYSISGHGFAKGDLSASFNALSGKLRGAAASGAGSVAHAGKTWTFSNLRVGLGTSTLALDGQLDDQMNLRFALNTPDISLLAPGSHGQLRAAGTLQGTLADPAVVGNVHGIDLDYGGIKVKGVDADVDFEPDAAGKDSKVDARVHSLSYLGRTLDAATFTLHGPPSNYQVHFTATAPGLDANLQAHGVYAARSFKGQLTTLALSGNEAALHLTLDRPVDMVAALDHVRVEWLCLVGTPGSVCADGDWTPTEWATTVMSNELPLNTLTAGMTPSVQYLGTISALARLGASSTRSMQGSFKAELANAEIAHRLASKKIEHTRIGSGTVNAQLGPAVITALAELGDGEVGSMHASFTAQRTTPAWLDMPLSGELHAQSAQCDLITLYVPDIDRASGQVNADMQVTGTLGAPRLSGSLKVSDGEIDVYQVNLAMRAIELVAQLGDAGLNFKGSARLGAGTVSADGHMEWHDLKPYGKFHMQGSNLRVADIPEAVIDASPDFDFEISGRKIEVTGKVLVPYARIVPKDITNAVRPSDDEIIVGTEPDDPNKRLEVVSTITLALGDKVSIDAMGLSARLGGSVVISSGYDAITRALGTLNILDGKYAAYARQLDIDTGQLSFNSGPIDNPGINIKAKKVFPDVTAYVTVRGTLLQPNMSFSSDPPLPQSQIVSLILAGGSLDSAQSHGGNVALGQGVAMLAQEYGHVVGIQEASLESDINNETSVVLGRYLNPRLYVSYGVSLTEQLNTLKLRYTLGDHWTIKGEAGQAQGADLVYTITK